MMMRISKKTGFFIISLFLSVCLYAQRTGIRGVIIDKESNRPIPGANIILDEQNIQVLSSAMGDFLISNASSGQTPLSISCNGYATLQMEINILPDKITDLGQIKLTASLSAFSADEDGIITFDESLLDDDSGGSQTIGNLSGASDDIYSRTAGYVFGVARFRLRGYETKYTDVFINGVNFNDATRGSFNYSSLGGMNNAFRNKIIVNGSDLASFSFGDLGGATNIITNASQYAPGVRANVGYTNRNYNWRGMATYSSGLMKSGWAFVASIIGRYAHEGVVPGTFYNSYGLFLSAEIILNPENSLNFTAFVAPT